METKLSTKPNRISDKDISVDYELIKDICSNALSDNPNDIEAFLMRAEARFYLKEYFGAVEDYDSAIALNPDNADYYCNRSIVKYWLEDYKGAVADTTMAIKLQPDSIHAYSKRGIAYYLSGNFTRALADFNKCIQLDPLLGMPWFCKGVIKVQMGKKKAGNADLQHGKDLGYRGGFMLYAGKWK